ncbi:hypothetical protein Q8791_23145 [Nocardiopsis sp. CT-R113]|uniref:Uncharacterized protein n=1 Tax=Nocardiopsis codii TaxID=3065942 RepID=A0ABU7KCZ9_9ACTN|nr:hypothetical protein [Nocardiopsis sp. CT-R113]MEE2040118.1 hypothetical protein [Nocardiopsis sp. CT-R113]
MPQTPELGVTVVTPGEYALLILVDNNGRASMQSGGVDHQFVGDLLVRLTGRFHQTNELPMLVTDDLAVMLTNSGWAPPFNPADHELSPRDWLELVAFDGDCLNEGFGVIAVEYPPRFESEELTAAISHGPLDRLNALREHYRDSVYAWARKPGNRQRLTAYEDTRPDRDGIEE